MNPGEPFTVAKGLAHAKRLMKVRPSIALRQALAIIEVEPEIAEAHLIASYALQHLGRREEALRFETRAVELSVQDPVSVRARELIGRDRDSEAEILLRRAITDSPNDPETTRLLAQIARRAGRTGQAEYMLRNCLRVCRSFSAAAADLQDLINGHGSLVKADSQTGTEEFSLSLKLNEEQVARTPRDPFAWLSYGHVLRIAGNSAEAISAYRKSIELAPEFGEAWWSIADLKNAVLTDDDVKQMERLLAQAALTNDQRISLTFALAKAYHDRSDASRAFQLYDEANQSKAAAFDYSPDRLDLIVDKMIDTFTPEFFAERKDAGTPESDPIFIVSMPRSGSTLLEQMLACHSQIEPTDELLEFGRIANALAGDLEGLNEEPDYVDVLTTLPNKRFRGIGVEYLVTTLPNRRRGDQFFIDKAPKNWLHVGLICLALPNSKIIDIRRNPMDCGFSNFIQNYASGREFSYRLDHIGRQIRSYVRLMAHIDKVLPGRIHHLKYEDLITSTEAELRAIFDYLGLPFEDAVLKFHESRRAVKTSSSEQVRQPVSSKGMNRWQAFSQWLDPLRTSLGPLAD